MIILIVIGYLIIGVCIAIGYIFFDYKTCTACANIEEYLDFNKDYLLASVLVGLLWPFSLLVAFIGLFLPFIFKKLLIFIDRLITDA